MDRIVGSAASMRVASLTWPPVRGTLKSTRTKTRLPSTGSAASVRTRASTEPATDQQGHVLHAVGETPFVVVPGQHLAEVAADHARRLGVEDRRVRGTVEVAGDERLVAVAEDALER